MKENGKPQRQSGTEIYIEYFIVTLKTSNFKRIEKHFKVSDWSGLIAGIRSGYCF
jgi:hypothetical protein